jgi:hypothetical protein
MQAADDVHLGRTSLDRLLAAGKDLLVAHHVATGFAEVGPEGTERAPIDADVRGIEVRVDVVPTEVAVLPLPNEVGQFTQFVEIQPLVPEHFGFGCVEPLSSLDTQSRADILPFLEALHRTLSIPVLYVSHAAEEVARLADHVVTMNAGQMVGKIQPVTPDPLSPLSPAQIKDLARQALEAGIKPNPAAR